jgi:hypothetical protein
MLRYGNIVLLTVTFLDVAKFTVPTPLSLLNQCTAWTLIPRCWSENVLLTLFDMEISGQNVYVLFREFIEYIFWFLVETVFHIIDFISVGEWTLWTIWHQPVLSNSYAILLLKIFTLSTAACTQFMILILHTNSVALVLNYTDRATAQQIPTAVNSRLSRPEPLLFLPSSFSVALTRLNGPCSRLTISQKIWQRWESNTGPLDL